MSTSGGATWNQICDSLDDGYSLALVQDTIYQGGCWYDTSAQFQRSRMAVYKSTNDGKTWKGTILSTERGQVRALAVDMSNRITLYAGGQYYDTLWYNYSRLYKTTDGGMSWAEKGKATFNKMWECITGICVDPHDASRILACTYNGVYISTDGAETWRLPTQSISGTCIAADHAPGRYYMGSSSGMWVSVDSGRSWQAFNNGLAYRSILSICYDSINNRLYAGTSKGGVYRLEDPLGVEDSKLPMEIPREYLLNQNYPNPFNPTTTISFGVPERGTYRLSVFNIFGQEVAVLVNGKLAANQYTVRFNAGNLSTGTYFYRLFGEKKVLTKKMLIIK